jgi:hypothetical protein
MPTLTVDFTSERPTYHLRRKDGTEQRATARSRDSAEAVISYYKFRGYTIKRKGHTMPLSKDQKRERRLGQVEALYQISQTGTLTGIGSGMRLKRLKKDGLVVELPNGKLGLTVAGRALLAEYDPPSATLIRNQTAESSDVSVAEPVEDLSWLLDDPSDLLSPDDDGYKCLHCGHAYCDGDCWDYDTDEQQPEAETHLTLEELKNIYDVFGLADDQQPLPQPEQPQPQPDCKRLIRALWSVHDGLAALSEYLTTTGSRHVVYHLTVVNLIVNRALSDIGEGKPE